MPKKILIVDDSASMRRMVAFTLKTAGFDVEEGSNGQEGLDKAAGQKFSLVITDLNMPVMDGITFIKKYRATPGGKFTPVLMLTTESQDSKKHEGKAAGATGWIVKPFQPEKLLQVIAKVVV
jgi:two-component system chemotaxis response regulator CheY